MLRASRRFALLTVAAVLAVTSVAGAGTTPPPGPPWVRELAQAQQIALQNNAPIFIYFTKTFCPHCVPVERDALPSAALRPAYNRAAWLFNTRNFAGDAADRVAEMIELRFGVSSYPQLILVDPESLTTIKTLGRTDQAIFTGIAQSSVRVTNANAAMQRLRLVDERVASLRKANSAAEAKKAILEDDIVVRFVALQLLTQLEPKSVAANAGVLLKVPHDPFRYQVCTALKESRDPSAAPALEALVATPQGSLNPNVLRMHAVEALAKCGGGSSVPVVGKFAATGEYNNGLTTVSINALAEIAQRDPKTVPLVGRALVQAYPPVPASPATGELERCTALAQKVHQQLVAISGKNVPFPTPYTTAARAQLMSYWGK